MTTDIFSDVACELGEGPLWHPLCEELCWFDILGKRLLMRGCAETRIFNFDEYVSAAGWIDADHLLIATQTALVKFQFSTGDIENIAPLEANNPITRSNDGRADPWGGFWIGTMGIEAEPEAGAIYRYYRGEVRLLFPNITIANAICFSPDRRWGYFACTAQGKIWRQGLRQEDGWPEGEPEVFIDFSGTGINPDGAVCDVDGNLWNAQWGAAQVAKYSSDGAFIKALSLPTSHVTCPAFGGAELNELYVTSARQGLNIQQLDEQVLAGSVFVFPLETKGQREHQIVL